MNVDYLRILMKLIFIQLYSLWTFLAYCFERISVYLTTSACILKKQNDRILHEIIVVI